MKSKIKVYFGSYGFECISEEILNTEIWMWGDLNWMLNERGKNWGMQIVDSTAFLTVLLLDISYGGKNTLILS